MPHWKCSAPLIPTVLCLCLFATAARALATTAAWTAKASMPTPRTWMSAAALDGKLYVFGGLSDVNKLDVVERYDPAADEWENRTAMPTARYGAAAVALDGKIYVLGGVNAGNQILKTVDVYDPVQDAWSAAAPMATGRSRPAAVAGPDGKIYAIGGSTSSTVGMSGYTALVEVYNPATDSWSAAAPLKSSRVGPAAAVSGGRIYVFGGYGVYPGYSARYHMGAEVYDPAKNAWSSAQSMDEARYGLAAATTSNGIVYLLGGKNESSVAPGWNEEFVPGAADTTNIAALPSGQRSELAAVSIGDVVYVVGGGGQWAPSAALDAGVLTGTPPAPPPTPPEALSPAAVTDLAAVPGCAGGSVLLAWSAPGGSAGAGTAEVYEVRRAGQAIADEAGWEAATPVTSGVPAPLEARTRQSMTVLGLTPGGTYHFAIRATNADLLEGALSNSASAQAGTGVGQTPWTVMVYAAADNNLDRYIHQDISSLELAAHNSCLNLVLFWDGAANGDSAYYHLAFDPRLSTWAPYVEGVNKWAKGEANMGDPSRLVGFVQWAKSTFPAQRYALVIRDHGDGLGGMEEDDRSRDHLTIPELDQALDTVAGGGANPLDLLFMDACLMGMLEDTYQFRGLAGVYVASEDVTWSSLRSNPHHDYFSAVGASTTAAQLGEMIVKGYSRWMETRLAGKNHTMAAVDMTALDQLVTATNALAARLSAGMASYGNQVQAARNAARRYWWTSYIDLADFAGRIDAGIADALVKADAQAVVAAVEAFVLNEAHCSRNTGSHGVSIFFPTDASSFYDGSRYDFAAGAVWQLRSGDDAFPAAIQAPTEGGPAGWGGLLSNYIQAFPGGPDVSVPPPPVAPQVQEEVFVPLIVR